MTLNELEIEEAIIEYLGRRGVSEIAPSCLTISHCRTNGYDVYHAVITEVRLPIHEGPYR